MHFSLFKIWRLYKSESNKISILWDKKINKLLKCNVIFSALLSMLPKHKLHKLLEPASLLDWAVRLYSEYITLSLWHMPELLNVFGSCHFDKCKFLFTSLIASNLFFHLIQIASSKISFYHHDYLATLLKFFLWFRRS